MSLPKRSFQNAAMLLLLFAPALAALPARAQFFFRAPDPARIEAARARFPDVKLELVLAKKQFALGEPIEVVMRYTNGGQTPLKVMLVNYDRSGRILDFGFSALDSEGKAVRDPYPNRGGIMGGLRSARTLATAQTFEQTATVNEWLAFDEPGVYQLSAYSGIVSAPADEKNPYGQGVLLQSAPVEIEIMAPDEASRLARLKAAEFAFGSGVEEYRRRAVRDLRWMLDERAIPLLVPLLESKDRGAAFEAQRALASLRDQKPVVAALLRRLDEPRPVSEGTWNINSLLPATIPWGADAPPAVSATLEVERGVRLEAKVRAAMRGAETSGNTANATAFAADLLNSEKNLRDADLWNRFWEGAALVAPEKQNAVAYRLNWEETEIKGGKLPFAIEIADLKRAFFDSKLQSELRSAAAMALVRRGDRSAFPLLAQDAQKIKPQFSGEALSLLGAYDARPRALKLLHFLRAPDAEINHDRYAIAVRLRNFGQGATLAELVAAAREMIRSSPYYGFPLVEAVALKSHAAALPLLRAYSGRVPMLGNSDEAARLLVRLQTPAARELAIQWLNTRNKSGLPSVAVVAQLGEMGNETHRNPGEIGYGVARHVGADAAWAASFVPALLKLWDETPSPRERAPIAQTLYGITQLPRESLYLQSPAPEKEAQWRAQWAAWKPAIAQKSPAPTPKMTR